MRQLNRRANPPASAAHPMRSAAVLEALESRVLLSADDQISEAIATTVGSTINSNIDAANANDVDMYKFPVSAGQTVGLDTDVAGLDSYIRLFSYNSATNTATQLAFSDDNAAPGELFTLGSYLEYTFPSAGTFYLGVSAYNNGSYDPVTGTGDAGGGSTGPYTLILTNITPNQPPTIGSLSDSPDPVTAPATFTLTAGSVADPDGTVARVQFFRESNGVAGFQVGDDSLLATDTTAPYTATIATSALPAGTHTYYARPVDNLGLGGNSASTTHTLNAPTGSISGTVWNDANGNKLFDAGESVLSNWVVYLDNNRNQVLDGGDVSTTTNASGAYTFSGLVARTYYVTTQTPAGWEQTSPGAGGFINPASAEVTTKSSRGVVAQSVPKITTTASTAPIYLAGDPVTKPPDGDDGAIVPRDAQSNPLIRLTNFQADPRFNTIRGQGFSVAVIDTGIDRDHPAFGPDGNADGIADRIVYQQDFANGDMNAQDFNGHGTNVASIVASQDSTNPGMAPNANIIALKVFTDSGSGNFSFVEQALQWVVANAAAYNIASINMSLGDTANYNATVSQYGLGDELASLAAMNVIVVSAAGNDFFEHNSNQGVSYPAADPNSLAVSAVYDANVGAQNYGGPRDFSTAADRITSFTQRSWTMTHAFAPGALITGGNSSGGSVSYAGTSQAAPHIAGIAALAQQLAMRDLGRRLTMSEFKTVLKSGVLINDGDDENDNVTNTGAYFRRVDVLSLGEAIRAMAPGAYTQAVTLTHGENDAGIDFGSRSTGGSITGKVFIDYDGDDALDVGEPGRAGVTVYIDENINATLDDGEARMTTDGSGSYTFAGLADSGYGVRVQVPGGFISTAPHVPAFISSGGTVSDVNFGLFPFVFSGSGANDSYLLRGKPFTVGHFEIFANGVTYTKSGDYIPRLEFNGGAGDDVLAVDLSTLDVSTGADGSFPFDVFFDGGADATPAGDLFTFTMTAAEDHVFVGSNHLLHDEKNTFFSGMERLTINGLGGADGIHLDALPIPVTINGGDGYDTLNANVAPIAPIVFNGGLNPFDIDQLNIHAGTFTFDTDVATETANLFINVVNPGASVVFNSTQHLGALRLNPGTTALLPSDGNRYLFTKSLDIQPGAQLSLADNDLLWDYNGSSGTVYPIARTYILDGRIATTNTGAGDTTLAPVDNVLYGATEWLGQPIDQTTIIGKYTYYGDADLNGAVTSDDYVQVDVNLGGADKQWIHGDFNLDGFVTSDEYVAIDVNLGKGTITPLAAAEPAAPDAETTALTITPVAEPETETIEEAAAGTIETLWTKPRKPLKKPARRR